MLYKTAVLKNFAIFTGKHLCWNLFFNNSFIKKRLQHRSFLANIEKFLRTPILKNICERLLPRVFLERFRTWTNNIRIEEDVFSKTKQTKNILKLSYMKKNLPFHDILHHFIFLYFSTAHQAAFALHNKRW